MAFSGPADFGCGVLIRANGESGLPTLVFMVMQLKAFGCYDLMGANCASGLSTRKTKAVLISPVCNSGNRICSP
jgi:hypothetical protein